MYAFRVPHAQPTTGRFSDLHPTERLLPARPGRTVDYASRISEESEQMLTAARPSRILTAFPFPYPKTRGLETCSRMMHLAKNTPNPTRRLSGCQ